MQDNNIAEPGPWLTEKAVAQEVGVCLRTVKEWIATDQLRAHRIGPRLVRIHRDDLRAAFQPL